MQQQQFEQVFESQVQRSRDILIEKAKQYATDTDRLANFKAAASMQGITPQAALAGMMAKHSYSVYAMAHSDKEYTLEQWDEKITDHVNYLILLRAVLEEQRSDANAEAISVGFDYLRQQREAGNHPKPTCTTQTFFTTKNIAEIVVKHLQRSIDERGYATVSQVLTASSDGPTTTLNDTLWGWRNIGATEVLPNGDVFYIQLPDPVYLGEN